jgi:hypothetical protein
MADPTVKALASLARSPGVLVRPFADRRGAVVVSRAGVHFVELEPGRMTEDTADWLYRLDSALSHQPSVTTVVHTEADVAELAAAVRTPPRGR